MAVRVVSETLYDLAQFIQQTDPDHIATSALAKLKMGTSSTALLTAAAVVAAGHLKAEEAKHAWAHPLSVLSVVSGITKRLPAKWRHLALLQALYYLTHELVGRSSGSFTIPAGHSRDAGGPDKTTQQFMSAVKTGDVEAADQHFAWLVQETPPETALGLLFTTGIQDLAALAHKIILPVECVRLLEAIGWEHAPAILRVPVRLSASRPKQRERYAKSLLLLDLYKPAKGKHSSSSPDEEIQRLRKALLTASGDDGVAELAEAFAGGSSLKTGSEALGLAAADMLLQTTPGKQHEIFAAHALLAADALRYIAAHPGVSARMQKLAILQGASWIAELRTILQSAGAWGEPYPTEVQKNQITSSELLEMEESLQQAISKGDQGRITALLYLYGEVSSPSAPVMKTLTKAAVSYDEQPGYRMLMAQAATESFKTGKGFSRWFYLMAAGKFLTATAGTGHALAGAAGIHLEGQGGSPKQS